MDRIILIGGIIFGIGILVGALNTKYRWSFWKYPYVWKNKKVGVISILLIIIGLLIVIAKAIYSSYI